MPICFNQRFLKTTLASTLEKHGLKTSDDYNTETIQGKSERRGEEKTDLLPLPKSYFFVFFFGEAFTDFPFNSFLTAFLIFWFLRAFWATSSSTRRPLP